MSMLLKRVAGRRPRTTKAHPADLVGATPSYVTGLGAAYAGDSAEILKTVKSHSVKAIITSPPYALHFKKSYGNPKQSAYIDWFLGFADEFKRVLRKDGSLVIEIGGAWNPKQPTRSVYHFELLVRLVQDCGFHLAQELFWFNRARIPSPAEWVNIQRIRVKDSVTPIWWLSPSKRPKASNRRVLKPYSESQLQLFRRGYNKGKRPSGHVAKAFERNNGGAIPSNLIEVGNTNSSDGYQEYCREHELVAHPARFPRQVPDFMVKFVTTKGDVVLDPFAGSNMTGYVAEKLGRRWISVDRDPSYVRGSVGRFLNDDECRDAVVMGRGLKIAKP